jgi:hypothetical protein
MSKATEFFGMGPDSHLAHIWLGPEPFYPYVKGYTITVETLLRRATRCPHEAKFLIIPILYNFRHAVEIQLKNIICLTENFQEGNLQYPKGHNLKKLWMVAKRLCGEGMVIPEWKQSELSEALILELDRLDEAGDKFRFPENTAGKAHFPHDGRAFSLERLRKSLPQVLDFLDTIEFGLRNRR